MYDRNTLRSKFDGEGQVGPPLPPPGGALVFAVWIQPRIDWLCCGVTTAQCHTLLEIAARGPVSLADLASALGVDASTMSRAVQGLVLVGLVARETSASDRRAVSITLTAQGRTVTKRIDRTFNIFLGEALAAVPADRRKVVLEGVGLLATAVRAVGRTPRMESEK